MSSNASPTYSEALNNWIESFEKVEEELKSAKKFSRAFQQWYSEALKPGDANKDKVDAEILWHAIDQFAWEFELEADPILERLDPGSRTKRIAINYKLFVKYLHEQQVIDANDLAQSLKAGELLERDLKRLQRASWVLRQNNVARTFETRANDKFYPVDSASRRAILQHKNTEDRTYEIVDIGENYVLADKCDHLGRPEMSESDVNPVKIRLPMAAIKYLWPGDTIDAIFDKAEDRGDYMVIHMFIGLDSGTEKFDENRLSWTKRGEDMTLDMNGLNLNETQETPPEKTIAEQVKIYRSSQRYRDRKQELMEKTPPEDYLFSEETFTEEWFAGREMDIGSDEEMWDSIDKD